MLSAQSTTVKLSRYAIIAQLKLTSGRALEHAILKLGSACAIADNAWLLATTHPLVAVHNLLRPVLRPTDQLVILDIARDKAAWTGFGPSEEARLRQMWIG